MNTIELNFDGLIGPTHHYGGLAEGNLASQKHRLRISSPRQAALQGLKKMKLLADLGIPQAVLPPHERPCLSYLRAQGFSGSDAEVLRRVSRARPELLSIASSASSMWAANAATVSPSADTHDQRVHITPANLTSTQHRQLEAEFTTKILRRIFPNRRHFQVHDPLPHSQKVADEGAANHNRICSSHGDRGLELFVYGRNGAARRPIRYPARQTLEASRTIAERHRLQPEFTLFVQQSPEVIDAGVFHNDVIAVANENVFICHAAAFVDQPHVLERIRSMLPNVRIVQISECELSVSAAVETYLFNSQLVTLASGAMLLLCPIECKVHPEVQTAIDQLQEELGDLLEDIRYIDVRQSMQNGGGPACLRLRIALNEEELAAMHQSILLTDQRYAQLVNWVEQNYRDKLSIEDLSDPELLREVRTALDQLCDILELNHLYSFQHTETQAAKMDPPIS